LSNNIDIAKNIILEAGQTVVKGRPGVHGSAENSFQMIADMWSVYIQHAHYAQTLEEVKIKLRPVDVAQMMVQLKQARAVYGNPQNRDNFVDETGYSALAGMLQLDDLTPKEEEK
jgi:Domain of unknown function (DUF6378)